jgi:predicted small lipoprotein YifL
MKRTILYLLLAGGGLLALTACGSKGPPSNEASVSANPSGNAGQPAEHQLAELTVDEVEAKIAKNDGKTFVYDNNHDDVYAAGHLPTAKLLGIKDIPQSAFPADKEATLIFYCANTH